MGNKVVDESGNVHEQGWDGQYRQKQGIFGPVRETDIFGNPKVDRDILGNPKAKTNWLGGQQTSSSGRGLFTSGSGGNNDFAVAIVGFLLTVTILALVAVIRLLYSLCRHHPRVGFPIVGALILIAALAMLAPPSTTNGTPQPTPYADEPTAAATMVSTSMPVAVVPTPEIASSPTAAADHHSFVVRNTGGDGVYLRRTPRMADKLIAWPDGTVLEEIGSDTDGDGQHWKHVRDPKGHVGWVPAQYVTTGDHMPGADSAGSSVSSPSLAAPNQLGTVAVRPFDARRDQGIKTIGQLIPGYAVSDKPEDDHFSVQISAGKSVAMSWGWCAATPAILTDNLRQIRTTLTVDGKGVDTTSLQQQWAEPGYVCRGPNSIFSGWSVGQHSVHWNRHIAQRLSDGRDKYGAGNYGVEYAITVR